jgi:hypothetical protein
VPVYASTRQLVTATQAVLASVGDEVPQAAEEGLAEAARQLRSWAVAYRPGNPYAAYYGILSRHLDTTVVRGKWAGVAVKAGEFDEQLRDGARVGDIFYGAEFGSKQGDNVIRTTRQRVGKSGRLGKRKYGRSAEVRDFERYRTAVEAQTVADTGGAVSGRFKGRSGTYQLRITGVRRGGLTQFPSASTPGWWLYSLLAARRRELERAWVAGVDAALREARA